MSQWVKMGTGGWVHLAPEGRHVYSRAIRPSFQAPEGRHVYDNETLRRREAVALNPDFIGVIIRAICAIRFICDAGKWHILPRWGYVGSLVNSINQPHTLRSSGARKF